MKYTPTIVVVDDNPRVLTNFQDQSEIQNVNIMAFETWDLAKEYLVENKQVDGLVLDAKGKLTADRQESESHLQQALKWISKQEGQNRIIPYAIHTAYFDTLETFSEEKREKKMFKKGVHSEDQVLNYLKAEIEKTPKLKIINHYPEPFQCFGTKYLDREYKNFLLKIIQVLENDQLTNPEAILFNPCRILLERVFAKINEVDEKILPHALLNFYDQRVGLVNCSRYLSGLEVTIREEGKSIKYQEARYWADYISQQVQIIIKICHPASHDIQKYTSYTFKSVLWALLDVLIWLKSFIDERK